MLTGNLKVDKLRSVCSTQQRGKKLMGFIYLYRANKKIAEYLILSYFCFQKIRSPKLENTRKTIPLHTTTKKYRQGLKYL